MILTKTREEIQPAEAQITKKQVKKNLIRIFRGREIVRQSELRKFGVFISGTPLTGVKNILGLEFYGLKKFFKSEFFDFTSDQCTVFVTRRCFLLAKWFLEFLRQDETLSKEYSYGIQGDIPCIINKQGQKNFIVTDKVCMAALKDVSHTNDGLRINIVDDISIHGKTLKGIGERFRTECPNASSIERHVYMGSGESLSYFPDRCSELAYRAGWCDLSQRIVELIRYLGLPYISCNNSFVKFGATVGDLEQLIQSLAPKFICERFGEGEDRQDLGKRSYFAVEKNITLFPHEKLKCIRAYYSTTTQSISIIPYVIMESMNFDEKKIGKILGNYITDTAIVKCMEAIGRCSAEQKASFAFNLVSCIASQSYGAKIFGDKIFGEDWIQDIVDCLGMSFGSEISNLVRNKDNFVVSHKQGEARNCREVTSLTEYKELAGDFIKEACVRSWLEFENGDNQTAKGVQLGYIQLEVLLNQLSAKQTSEHEKENLIYAGFLSLINYCDSGKMNISCPVTGNESYIKAGELGCILASEYLKERCHNGKIDAEKTNDIIIGLMNLLEDKYHRGLLI